MYILLARITTIVCLDLERATAAAVGVICRQKRRVARDPEPNIISDS